MCCRLALGLLLEEIALTTSLQPLRDRGAHLAVCLQPVSQAPSHMPAHTRGVLPDSQAVQVVGTGRCMLEPVQYISDRPASLEEPPDQGAHIPDRQCTQTQGPILQRSGRRELLTTSAHRCMHRPQLCLRLFPRVRGLF